MGTHDPEAIRPTRGLDEFVPELRDSPEPIGLMAIVNPEPPHERATPKPLSRVESTQARRAGSSLWARTRRRAHGSASAAGEAICGSALAVLALTALHCDSIAYAAARKWSRRTAPPRAPISAQDATDHLEANGSAVATLLALAVVGYGSFLGVTWRDTVPPVSASAITASRPLHMATTYAIQTPSPMRAAALDSPVVVRDSEPAGTRPSMQPAASTMNAATIATLWRKNDTRSLERAFSSLRSDTLAFHSCGMHVTTADRAVARCEDARHVTWTLDFERTAGRWAIQRVSSR